MSEREPKSTKEKITGLSKKVDVLTIGGATTLALLGVVSAPVALAAVGFSATTYIGATQLEKRWKNQKQEQVIYQAA